MTNNYRVNGGGGFTMYQNARGFRSSAEVRQLIIDWVRRTKRFPLKQTTTGDCGSEITVRTTCGSGWLIVKVW